MATYSHKYSYIEHICTQIVCAMASQHVYSQEADEHCTKLIYTWCNTFKFYSESFRTSPATLECGNLVNKHYYT